VANKFAIAQRKHKLPQHNALITNIKNVRYISLCDSFSVNQGKNP